MSLKRILALALVFCMVLGMVPAPAYAEETATTVATGDIEGGFTWTLDDTGTMTISGTGSLALTNNTPWPDEYVDQVVRAVYEDGVEDTGESFFQDHTNLKEVVLPESVTFIAARSFCGCTSLTTVELPSQLETIGTGAFMGCTSLTAVELPDTLQNINLDAFNGCTGLTELTIPASATEVSFAAFAGCSSLKKITFLGDAPNTDSSAFYNVSPTVYYPADNATWTEEFRNAYGGSATWEAYGETQEPEVPAAGTALILNQSESVTAAVGETLTYTFTPSSAGDYILHYDFAPASGVKFDLQVPCAVSYFVDTTSYHVLTGLVAEQTYTFTFTAQEDAISGGSIGVSNITALTGASLNYTEISGNVGDTITVRATPNGGSYPECHWSVEDTSVATVSGSGCDATVTLATAGSTKLTVTVLDVTDLAMSYEYVIDVTVTEAAAEPETPAAGNALTLGDNTVDVTANTDNYFTFTPTEDGEYWFGRPNRATDTWSNQSNLTAEYEYCNASYIYGDVYQLTANTTYIFVLHGMETYTDVITVKKTVNSATITPRGVLTGAYIGECRQALFYLEDGTIDALTATSSNEAVAAVTTISPAADFIYVNCYSLGSTTISVTTRGGGSFTWELTVYPTVDGGELVLDTPIDLQDGNVKTTFTYTPTEDGLYWLTLPAGTDYAFGMGGEFTENFYFTSDEYTGWVLGMTADQEYSFEVANVSNNSAQVKLIKTQYAESISFDVASAEGTPGTYSTVGFTLAPANSVTKGFTVESENYDHAGCAWFDGTEITVNWYKPGTTNIVLTTNEGVSATLPVTTTYQTVTQTLTMDGLSVDANENTQLNLEFIPSADGFYFFPVEGGSLTLDDSTVTSFIWDNELGGGMVYEMKANTTYTLVSPHGEYRYLTVHVVQVEEAQSFTIPATLSGYVGETITLPFTYTGAMATEVESSDTTIVQCVGGNAQMELLELLAVGTAIITVTDHHGNKQTCEVTAAEAPTVTGFTVDPVTMIHTVDQSDLTYDHESTVYKVYDPGNKNPNVIVTYSDGNTITCPWNELEATAGLHLGHVNPLQDTSAWEVGDHSWTVMLLDDGNNVQATYGMTITILENPIASVTAAPATMTEGLDVNTTYDENDNLVPFYDMGMYGQDTELTLTYSDGTVITSTWWDLYDTTGCYHVESISSWRDSSTWIPGNSYTWTIAIKDDQGNTYATCDIPVYVEKLDRQTLTLDTAATVSLNAYQHKILEFDATESGYLWLWTEGTSFEVINRILDADFERIYGDPHNANNKYGVYFPVTAGKHYDIYVYSPSEVSNSITATMMSEATDIQLETTNVEGYVGQVVIVDFEGIPAGSRAELDFNHVVSQNTAVAEYRGGDQNIWIGLVAEGNTTVTVTYGGNTHIINVTAKNPDYVNVGDVKNVSLEPGKTYVFGFTAAQAGAYYVCWDKAVEGIITSSTGISDFRESTDGAYDRIRMQVENANQDCVVVLENTGNETQTFDLYLGEAVELQQDELVITGPAEVKFGAKEVELLLSMPMFADYGWLNWYAENINIYDNDNSHALMNCNSAGTFTITVTTDTGITASHTVIVKPYGDGALGSWTCPGDGNTVTMTFTPAEDGWYWLNYNDQEYINFTSMGPVGTGEQPLTQESYNKGSGSGMIYKLEGGKTYTFEATDVYSSHTFFMHKLDVATSVTVTPSITGKVHEEKFLSVETNGFCSWDVESSDESVVMTGAGPDNGRHVFLLGEGTATLTVTDQDGNKYTCDVTVSGELGVEEFNGWDEMGLAANDSQTYNFTAYKTGLFWINSELGHNLGIKVEQNGTEIAAEYEFGYHDGNDRQGKIYSLVDGVTYQITFTSDHNMTTFINAETVSEANQIECWRTDVTGTEGDTAEIYYELLHVDGDGNRYMGVGQVTVTSDDNTVAKGVRADGNHAVIELVGEGSTIIHINVNGVTLADVPVTVNPSVKATSFTVENVTLYERLDTTKLTYDDGRTYMVYDAGRANPYVTFELTNGLSFNGYWEEVQWQTGLRMGHYEVLENTASWGVGDHQWVVDLADENGKILGTCEITVTIVALDSMQLTVDQETSVSLTEGQGIGLKVTPDKEGFLCLWEGDRSADFEMAGAMDSAGFRCDTNWIYDHESDKGGWYIEVSEGVTYEFFVKANNGTGYINFTPEILPAATDITMETTEIVGYPGQYPIVKFERTPALSIIDDLVCETNTNSAVAEWNGCNQSAKALYFNLKSVGDTVITLKMGENTYDIKVTVKEPPALELDTPATGSLGSEEGIVYAFTPAEDGNYMICVNNGIDIGSENGGQFDCGTAEYNRVFLSDLKKDSTYYIAINNYNEEARNYELSIGKAELATGMGIVGNQEMTANSGEQQALELTFSPKYGYLEAMMSGENYITWESDNPDAVYVSWADNRSAYVNAENPGTATITATSTSGLTATFTITVKDYAESCDQVWTGTEDGGELNFSFTPVEDGYYQLHWRDVWGPDPVLTADGDQPLFSFEYGWSWSNGFVYQMEAGKTYNFHCDWINNAGQIYMKKVEMATQYVLDSQSITGQVHGKGYFGVLSNGIPYWEMTSSNEDVVMIGPGGSDWRTILYVGEGTATLTVTDHLGGVHQCEVTVSGTMDTVELFESELIGLKANDSVTYTFRPRAPGMHWFGHELGKDLTITVKQYGVEVTGYTFATSREGYTGNVYQLSDDTYCEITVNAGDARVLTTLFLRWGYEANQMDVWADSQLGLVVGEEWNINYDLRYVDEIEDINISTFGKPVVTSSDDAVVQVTYDGGRAKLVAVDEGTATVTFKLNGETMHEITVTVTKPLVLTLGEKLDVNYGETDVQMIAQFTPEKTGYYSIYMDTPVHGFMAIMGFWGTDVEPGVKYTSIYLEAGNTYEIISWLYEHTDPMSAQLWVEETDHITALEIVEEPVKKTYFVGSLDSGLDIEGLKLKVTWSDGTTSSYTVEQLIQSNGIIGGFTVDIYGTENEDGQTGVVTISCCEGSDTYDVTLVENPVASIEVVGELEIPENTYGESNGDFWIYSPDFVRDALKLKVNYKDGTSVEIPATQTELNGYFIYQDVEYAQNYQPWTKDSTNTIHFMYMGHEATAEVKIVDNWIESIEVSGTPTTEFRFGNGKYGWMENDIYYFAPANYGKLEGLSFKVTRTDGETMEFSAADLTWIYGDEYSFNSFGWYDGLPVEVYVDGFNYDAYNQVVEVTEPGEVTMTVRYGWKTATYTINLLAKEEVHVHEIKEVEAHAATYQEAGNIQYWYCESCHTIFGDAEGNTTLIAEDVIIPKLVKVEVQKTELNQQIDEVLNNTTGEEPVKEVVVQVQDNTTGNSVSSVVLPKASVDKIVEANDQAGAEEQVSLTVELNTATVTLDSKALQTITEAAGDSREITLVVEKIAETELTQEQQNAVEEHEVEMVISAELVGTDGVISETFGGGTATVKIPFTPAEGTNGSDYKLLYVADNGETQVIDTTYADGCLVFTLEHFSEYVVVKEEKLAEVKWAANAQVGSSLALYLAFNVEGLEDTTGYYAVITRTYADGSANDVITVGSSQWKTMSMDGESYYYVKYSGLAAKEMTDTIQLQIFDGSGKAVSEIHTDSLQAYAMRKLNEYTTKNDNSTIYAQMLAYGAAAQRYFGYNEENLADAQMSALQKSFAMGDISYKTTNNAVTGQNYVASNLQLQNTIKLYMKFNNMENAAYAKITFTNHNGKAKTVTVDKSEFAISGTAIVIDELVAADYNVMVTCTVYDSSDNVLAYATDSVENYIGRNYQKNALYGELLKYMMAAYNFFH